MAVLLFTGRRAFVRRPVALGLAMALVMAGSGCSDLLGLGDDDTQVWVSAAAMRGVVGDTMRLGATTEIDGVIMRTWSSATPWPADLKREWSSSDPSIVEIDGDGLMRLRADGTARIRLVVDGVSDFAPVRVGPTRDPTIDPFVSIATGAIHSCAVKASGSVFCWGQSGMGQLGTGVRRDYTATVSAVDGIMNDAVQVEAGSNFSCAVTRAGAAYCWGRNNHGQLGDGSKSTRARPVRVRGSFTWRAVTAGIDHACGLSVDGIAFCWGRSMSANGPRRVSDRPFTTISAGGWHACAVDAGGDAYCWGENDHGQLGAGDAGPGAETLVTGGHRFVQVSAGTMHTCGVRVDGVALCWGHGGNGRLGTGAPMTATPMPVLGELRFRSISAGLEHTCGITTADRAYCWGRSVWGQLGSGLTAEPGLTMTQLIRDHPVAVATDRAFVAISAGSMEHTCAISSEGAAYCWGNNGSGQLGYGKHEFHPETMQHKKAVPVRVVEYP